MMFASRQPSPSVRRQPEKGGIFTGVNMACAAHPLLPYHFKSIPYHIDFMEKCIAGEGLS